MKTIPNDAKQVVLHGVERACKEVNERIAPLGFVRTKKMLWTRRHTHTADVIRFCRTGRVILNYSVNLHVELSIRVLNDTIETLAPNGPSTDVERLRAGRYHHRFNAQTGSTYDRCVHDLVRFILEQGEPWFIRFREPEALLGLSDSPIPQPVKERLRAAIAGRQDMVMVEQSLKLLGIKARDAAE